jgi:predicted membrane GTPase involved in stress response
MHEDSYPVEQIARHVRTRFQIGFARLTTRMLPDLDDVAYEASGEGLRILGASELALKTPGEIVRQIHGDDVVLEAPRVRLAYRGRACEPVMGMRASVSEAHAPRVVQDLLDRGASIEEIAFAHGRCTVRALGRLRLLLGFPDALMHLSDDTSDLVMWLSHYTDAHGDNDFVSAQLTRRIVSEQDGSRWTARQRLRWRSHQ